MPIDIALKARAAYVARRIKAFSPARVATFARQIADEQNKWMPKVFVDMVWWAAFHDTAFIDYYEADFALLSKAERKTYMTSVLQHHLAVALNDREAARQLENKIAFNKRFAAFLGREWIDLTEVGPEGLREFAAAHPVIIAKVPVSREGHGVFRYDTTGTEDWEAFHRTLTEAGQVLIEQPIVQHPYLARYCADTVNTTRVTTYFDGTDVHVLVAVQKFGRGSVSDQFSWGGFFTMLDENGRSRGPGYTGKKLSRYEVHPDSGASIVDFQVPLWDQVIALVDEAARVVPGVRYVGWDVAVGPEGPVLIEGNWVPGLYENRVSATGIRHGARPRHEAVMPAARRR